MPSGGNNRVVAQVHSANMNSKADDTSKESSNVNNSSLTTEQYQQLMSLLNQANSTPTTDLLQSGSMYSICSSMTTVCITDCHNTNDWILDSGATDHITCHSELLSNTTPCDIKISLPNGHVTTVHFKEKVVLTAEIILTKVLLIPEFQFNLISVSKLFKTLKYEAHFNAHHCIIHPPYEEGDVDW